MPRLPALDLALRIKTLMMKSLSNSDHVSSNITSDDLKTIEDVFRTCTTDFSSGGALPTFLFLQLVREDQRSCAYAGR